MAASFHRLTAPKYTGGLPASHDYINNAASGTPALTDGAKVDGPNAGTYFVAFGEDSTSSNTNRPNKALAQNTDYLDDLLRRDIALPKRTDPMGPTTSPVSTVKLTGPGIFLGVQGTSLDDLFHITDQNDADIIDKATGSQCVVDTIDATIGSGFSTGDVTLSIYPPIPSGSGYRVYYGVRANLATLPPDALTDLRIRMTPQTDGLTASLLTNLQGNQKSYYDGWSSTIYDLARSGLDERYRRASTVKTTNPSGFPAGWSSNYAGSGGWYLRDGPGMTGFARTDLTNLQGYKPGVGYGLEGLWIADPQDKLGPGIFSGYRMGALSSGFVAFGTRRYFGSDMECADNLAPSFALFFAGDKQAARATLTPGEQNTLNVVIRTFLPANAPVTLQGRTVTVSAPAFFAHVIADPYPPYSPILQTAVALGYDLLELAFPDGSVHAFTLEYADGAGTQLTPTQAGLSCLDGSAPNFPAGTTAKISKWIRTTFGIFNGAPEYFEKMGLGTNRSQLRGTIFAAAPALTNESGNEIVGRRYVQVYARTTRFNESALVWGGHDQAAQTYIPVGSLNGDGSASVAALTATGRVYADRFETPNDVSAKSMSSRIGLSTRYQLGESTANPAVIDFREGNLIRIADPKGNASKEAVLNLSISLNDSFTTDLIVVIERTKSASYDPTVVTKFGPSASGYTMKFESTYGANLTTWDSSMTSTMYDVFYGRILQYKIFWTAQRFPK